MSKFIDEFRNSELAQRMAKNLTSYNGPQIKLMEVCGTHTMSIFKFGIRDLLPESIKLVSGPGCPVCVTPGFFIDAAIQLARREDFIITTFGDMMRVPGDDTTLLREKALGRDIRVVYSPLDCLKIAAENPGKKVVFLAIGFETTTPVIALAISRARAEGINNFFALCANKTMPEALKLLAMDKEININGYLYPGHVSAIVGTGLYEEMAEKYKMHGVVAGFEPLDVLQAITLLASNIQNNNLKVENEYSRVVPREGNPVALGKLYEVFEPCDAIWRGIGNIPGSGLKLRDTYHEFDAWKVFDLKQSSLDEPKGCQCGEVLKGKKTPVDCPLFNTVCTPENPVGSCMVSSEGTCSAYYKYGKIYA